MNVPTSSDDRIVDTTDDGGNSSPRASAAGAVLGLVTAVLVVASTGFDLGAVVFAPAMVTGGIAAAIDVRSGRLPDRWTAATAASGLAAALLIAGVGGASAWASGVAIALVPMLMLHLAAPCALGFGDVKYAAALGGLLGLVGGDIEQRALAVSAALTIASALAMLSATLGRRAAIAFGPWLLVGTAVTLFGAGVAGSGIVT